MNRVVPTMDLEMPAAQAIAVRRGADRGLGVGRGLPLRPWRRAGRVDLGGSAVLPGFCDTHIHVAALGFVMGYADPAVSHSPLIGWITATPVQDRSLAGLTARLPDGFDGEQRWADEAQLCHWVLKSGDDVLRTGAMGLTG